MKNKCFIKIDFKINLAKVIMKINVYTKNVKIYLNLNENLFSPYHIPPPPPPSNEGYDNRLSRLNTARGLNMRFFLVGPTKVKV